MGYWKEHKTFYFDDKDTKKQIYAIDAPPPFTSGELHMGNVLSFALLEMVGRYKKMKGFNILLPNGWDAQGFPTERAVEKKYGKGLGRADFYSKCLEVAKANISRMKEQIDRLGFVFDPKLEYSTIDPEYRKKVQLSLVMMHEKGYVYRDTHPVMWCTSCTSAIANAETEEREEETNLNYITFKAKKGKAEIIVATTRPELLHACVSIAVNSNDEKYSKFVGKSFEVPIYKGAVTVVADEKVDSAFGTGAEMICTFGDKADIELFHKHDLGLIEAIDEKGNLLNAGDLTGTPLDEAREAILLKLKEAGFLVKQEKIKHTVKTHDRCGTRVEFINSKQWFIKIKEHSDRIKQLANEVKWHPESGRQRLYDWANFIDWDWTISRNRVYGTPIPFWFCEKCDTIVPAKREKLPVDPATDKAPIDKCPKCGGSLVGESATCDVWVDSSITPLIILGWPENKKLVERGLPNALREQGTEIIRTWAFYTLFRVWALTGEKPWEEALINGMILGFDGKIMHKSAGNGFAPDELFAKGYSADSIRLWAAMTGAVGKDKQFSYKDIDYAKSFLIKLYNTANFVNVALSKGKIPKEEPHKDLNAFDIWILNRLNSTIKKATDSYEEMNFYEAANSIIDFYWHEFADFYIENVKHRVYSEEKRMEKSKGAALFTLKHVLQTTLQLLAPIVPFICEEMNSSYSKASIFESSFPKYAEREKGSDYAINGLIQKSAVQIDYEDVGAFLNVVISSVRKEKATHRIALNKEITAMNINIPEEYYSAVVASKDELKLILKARGIEINKAKEFSVSITV